MLRRVLIDNNLRFEDGAKGETFIEYRDQTQSANTKNTAALVLELQYASVEGIQGYRLVEEKIFPDGRREMTQEFNLTPDIAYSLFKHWEELDKKVFSDD